jgi:DNA-binding winged helix-turn-helix (wHTH) protein
VWPDRIVEGGNLWWQIRRGASPFGADRTLIRTISGRGDQFTAEIETVYGGSKAPELPPYIPEHRPAPIADIARLDFGTINKPRRGGFLIPVAEG